MIRCLSVLICLATPAFAQAPDRATLEEPGRIWIRETLHPSAKLGLTVPYFSYVQFKDGAFEDVFASVSDVIFTPACEGVYPCDGMRRSAPIFTGRFALSDDGMVLSEVTRSPLVFDRASSAMMLQADSFSRGETAPVVALNEDVLERTTPVGQVRYVAAHETQFEEILGLTKAVEVAITSPDDLSRALLALAQMGVWKVAEEDQKRDLLKGYTLQAFDLPEAEQDIYRATQIASGALRFITSDMLTAYEGSGAGDGQKALPDVPNIADALPASLLENLSEDAQKQLSERAKIAQQAIPAIFALKHTVTNRDEPTEILCHGL